MAETIKPPAALAPLSSTVRVVEWDELPASVREIREGFDPLGDGVLMLHQRQAIALQREKSITAFPKGRRTGITFATMLGKTIDAASRKSAGGRNVFYIGDTKEKGLEAIGYCAKFARVIAQAQGEGISGIEEFLFEDQDERGNSRHINAYRIRFASGFQVCALSSRPANIRGLQGDVVIDEAAFHPDVEGVLEAVVALLIWGARITVISSHNGKKNPFAQFCRDVEAGRYGADAAVMTITFDDAVRNGLYERVCLMNGTSPTAEGKKAWYAKIRNGYGVRKAAMREELDAIPRDGSGVVLPGVWIEAAMPVARPVLRLALDDDFAALPDVERRSYVADWIRRYLDPVLESLDPKQRHVFGQDYARHRDFSIFLPLALTSGLKRVAPFIVEMNKVPGRQQKQIVWHVIPRLPNWGGGAFDATGSGETMAEDTADEFGATRVHQIKLNRAWYGTWFPKYIQLFEDGMLELPRDENIAADHRQIEDVDGITLVTSLRRQDLKDPDLQRHGDSAVAGCLAQYAALNLSAPIEFAAGARLPRGMDNLTGGDASDLDDDALRYEQQAW
ncbi:hypothetical protein CKO44_15935 [Rubrivivax gelatinosus]|uniref:hypothetical protein n=1 Tax=Rubrivivax gelatinosus TaxID=28068 RepID=UPI001907E787|nr:hypothetical protein [Rubrivivax gelatinosus]MBK1614959.1 hypothetical protein [Rubrivivax gelatinosus]